MTLYAPMIRRENRKIPMPIRMIESILVKDRFSYCALFFDFMILERWEK